MTEVADPPGDHEPEARVGAEDDARVETDAIAGRNAPSALAVGVTVWLASELMFFAGLFAAYFYLRGTTKVWPPHGVELSAGRTGIATCVLIASSGTMHFATRAAAAGRRSSAVRWLIATIALGLIFLGNQAWEYAEAPFHISSNAYGSMFYLMTGFHGLHVIGGILFMIAVIGQIGGSTSKAPVGPAVEVCGYYWHFVDVVWVVMFATIYLLR